MSHYTMMRLDCASSKGRVHCCGPSDVPQCSLSSHLGAGHPRSMTVRRLIQCPSHSAVLLQKWISIVKTIQITTSWSSGIHALTGISIVGPVQFLHACTECNIDTNAANQSLISSTCSDEVMVRKKLDTKQKSVQI